MDGLTEVELSRVKTWVEHNPRAAMLHEFLASPRLILFWVVLLVGDLLLLLVFLGVDPADNPAIEAVHLTVSALFAVDVATRFYLYGESHGQYLYFWKDKLNVLDAILVTIDIVTLVVSLVLTAGSAQGGGAVKSARTVRLLKFARSARGARILRMGRICVLCGKNWEWALYQLENKLQKPIWKAVGMLILMTMYLPLTATFFFLLRPVGLDDGFSAADAAVLTSAEARAASIRYGGAVWEMWSFMVDPGSHTDICERYGHVSCTTLQLFAGAISTLGIIYFAAVLGFVVDGIRDFLDELKRGTRAIVEADHIIILGFSVKSVALICEVCDALESEGGGTIVIMDDCEKQGMDEIIEQNIIKSDLRNSHLVTRRGSPMVQQDLMRVSASSARSIIIMREEGVSADVSDAQAVRVVLALKGLHPPLRGHVVVELMDIDNRSIVELIGEPMVETVVSHDIIGRLMLLAARNPGVNGVYDEVFGFQNDEFYLRRWPELEGRTFREITLMMPDAVPIGFRRHNRNRPGRSVDDGNPDWVHTPDGRFQKYGIEINPLPNAVLEPGDALLVLAADDDTYAPLDEPFALAPQPTVRLPARTRRKDRTLVCGWRRDIDDMIMSLDAEVKKGSELHIMCELTVEEREAKFAKSSSNFSKANLKNLTLHHHVGNSAVRRSLEQLPLASFHYVLILADEAREDRPLDSDAHNLATLLLLRDLRHRQGVANVKAKMQREKFEREEARIKAGLPRHHHHHHHHETSSPKGAGHPAQTTTQIGATVSSPSESIMSNSVGSTTAGFMSPTPNKKGKVKRQDSLTPEAAGVFAAIDLQRRASANDLEVGSEEVSVEFTSPGVTRGAARRSPTSSPGKKHHRHSDSVQAMKKAIAHADMCMIAVEILDARTKSTLQSEPSIRAAADYLLSHTTMSKVLAMVVMQREVKGILEELLSEEGQSFFVHQATRFCLVGERVSFWEVAARALECREVLIGFRPMSSGVTIINPLAKSEPRVWGEYDLVVVCCQTATMMTPSKAAFQRLKRYTEAPLQQALRAFKKGFEGKEKAAFSLGAAASPGTDTGVDIAAGVAAGDHHSALWGRLAAKKQHPSVIVEGPEQSADQSALPSFEQQNRREVDPPLPMVATRRPDAVSQAAAAQGQAAEVARLYGNSLARNTSVSEFTDDVVNFTLNNQGGRILGSLDDDPLPADLEDLAESDSSSTDGEAPECEAPDAARNESRRNSPEHRDRKVVQLVPLAQTPSRPARSVAFARDTPSPLRSEPGSPTQHFAKGAVLSPVEACVGDSAGSPSASVTSTRSSAL